jgi:thymidylate synthase (FAD)
MNVVTKQSQPLANTYAGSLIKLFDHGSIQLVDSWGSDERIIEAARMSTGKGFLGWGPRCPHGNKFGECLRDAACASGTCETTPGDEKLLAYLWKNKHATPFEMVGVTIEVQAPIFVFREWHRHRVPFGYNELSARYTPLPDFNYVPTVDRLTGPPDAKNKQAGTHDGVPRISDEATARTWLAELRQLYEHAERVYQEGLAIGVPKELARLPVPVGRYSRMRATGNLRGWLAFLALRDHKSAQEEIRTFAYALGEHILTPLFPRSMKLFNEGRT